MKVGIVGTRGIPNAYGGFEQFAEYLSVGLVEAGHEVTVYCIKKEERTPPNFKGVQLIYFKDYADQLGTVGQFLYDFKCIIDSRKRNFDIILNLGYTSSAIWYSFFPKKSVLLTNMDGLEWKRSKFSTTVQKFLKYSERKAVTKSDYLIADSLAIQAYIKKEFHKNSKFIAYGANVFNEPDEAVVEEFGAKPYQYSLLIARMEPENNIDLILTAYSKTKTTHPLIVIGNISNEYGRKLVDKFEYCKNIIFNNAIYDIHLLNNLRFYSKLYFHGHSVGGTNPSLLEAMACKSLIVAHDNEFNRSVLSESAFYFSTVLELQQIIDDEDSHNKKRLIFISENISKIKNNYTWKHIINTYECFFKSLLK